MNDNIDNTSLCRDTGECDLNNECFWSSYIQKIDNKVDLIGVLFDVSKKEFLKTNENDYLAELIVNKLTVDSDTYEKLKSVCEQKSVTLNAIFQYVWHKILSVYANTTQTVIGTFFGENDDEQASVLPFIVDHEHEKPIIEAIVELNKNFDQVNKRRNVDLSKVKNGMESFYDCLFLFDQNPKTSEKEQVLKLEKCLKNTMGKLDCPLAITVYEHDGKVSFCLYTLNEIMQSGIIEDMLQVVKNLIEQIANNYDQKVSNLKFLNSSQYQKVVVEWNENEKEFETGKRIHDLFEEQVDRTPNQIAVIYEEKKLTYQNLNEQANRFAHYLVGKYNLKADDLVVLYLERSELIAISIFSILKAGGAYVPIDPNFPDDRVKYVLENTQTRVVLANNLNKDRISKLSFGYHLDVVVMDSDEMQTILEKQDTKNLITATTSTNLAYVLYTSGSTGQPKGAMNEHRGIINRITWMNEVYDIQKTDVVLQKSPYTFDISVYEILWPLWYGAAVAFAKPNGHKDPNYLMALIDKLKISIIHFVPSMLTVFEQALSISKYQLPSLRYIYCTGEVLTPTQVRICHSLLPHTRVINLYGPTEASIEVLYYECVDPSTKNVYLGKPIYNIKCYIVDKNLTPVPIGAIGELCIGGVAVGRGYLNKPDLTAEKYIDDVFNPESRFGKGRMYRTGDLVKMVADGNIQFIGRNDFQVKLRGHRIELGEISSVLSSYPSIEQSVIVVKDNLKVGKASQGILVGYYIANETVDEKVLLKYMRNKLPEYMIPSALIQMDKFPLNHNGKVEHKALPDPKIDDNEEYTSFRNETEAEILKIWADLLKLENDKIGITHDFFKLGGDSIMAIQLISKLRQNLGLNIIVNDIFSYRNVRDLYDNVIKQKLQADHGENIKTEQGILKGQLEMLPVQKWYFENLSHDAVPTNQIFVIKTPKLEIDRLFASIKKLVNHHDALRISYKKSADSEVLYTQHYNEDLNLEAVKVVDLRSNSGQVENFDKVLRELSANFDLEKGPLFRIAYIHGYADESARLYFVLNYLISDNTSFKILAQDLEKLYNGNELGLKGSSFRQWTESVISYKESQTYSSQVKENNNIINLKYIENVLSDYESIQKCVVLAKQQVDSNGLNTGRKYLVAYCVKDLEIKENDVSNYVSTWESLYQSGYLLMDNDSFEENIKGWNSSYTGNEIDKEDMLEWVNATVDKIKYLKPKVVLEIGSGSGLILFNVINDCEFYYASDFSQNAINYTNKIIENRGLAHKVLTSCNTASELQYEKFTTPFDTVIINSVVQYFPDLDYLDEVLMKAIENIKGNGHIFIGDVRDFRLLKCFHFSVQSFKNQNVTKANVDYFVRREKELLVSPAYFIHLKETNKFISKIEILAKIGEANHEMNKFRYDVILHINKNTENDENEFDKLVVNESNFKKVLNLNNFLEENTNQDVLCIKYPNKRILKDYIECNLLYDERESDSDDSFNTIEVLSMKEIQTKCEMKNYKCKFYLDVNEPSYFNVIIYTNNHQYAEGVYVDYVRRESNNSDFANNPLLASKLISNEYTVELKEYLSSKLPAYMVPDHYVVLENLPFKANGRLDTKALPEPSFVNQTSLIGQEFLIVASYGKNLVNYQDETLYWKRTLQDFNSARQLNLVALDAPISDIVLELQISKSFSDINRAFHTEIKDIILLVLGNSLADLLGSHVNHILFEEQARDYLIENLYTDNTVGCFTTVYPLRLETTDDILDSLKNVKETLRQVPNEGIGYGALIGFENQSKLPKIHFKYVEQIEYEKKVEDLWSIDFSNSNFSSCLQGRDSCLSISCIVFNGKVKFQLKSKLKTEMFSKLAQLLTNNLKKVTEHISSIGNLRSYLTISDVENVISQDYLDKIQENKEIENVFLANNLQQGFLYHALHKGTIYDVYIEHLYFEYKTKVDLEKLKLAWVYAQSKYATLRLRFAWDEELVQIIDKNGVIDWNFIDLSEQTDEIIQENFINELQVKDKQKLFKLDEGNLFRIYLIKRREDFYKFIFSFHHAILDGWSIPLLIEFIHDTYFKLVDGETVDLLDKDKIYFESQRFLQNHQYDNDEYWNNYVETMEEKLDLNGLISYEKRKEGVRINDYQHTQDPSLSTLVIEDDLYKNLKLTSAREGVTLNGIMQFVWHKILSIYGHNKQTIVGTVTAGRNIPIDRIEDSVGLYVNTVPLIVNHEEDITVIESIKKLQATINEINSRSNVNLVRLQKNGENLFNSLFVYQNYPDPFQKGEYKKLQIQMKEGMRRLEYPLVVSIDENNMKLYFNIHYADIFSKEIIDDLMKIIKVLCEQIVNDPSKLVSKLEYLNEDQYQQIIRDWNNNDQDFPIDKRIHNLFEEQVDITPDMLAVVYEDFKLTFTELNKMVNRMAHYLKQNYEIKPNELITLVLDRKDYVIGLLASLKTGGAYVPIDSNFPDERIKFILEDMQPKIILTNKNHFERVVKIAMPKEEKSAHIICIEDEEFIEKLEKQENTNPITNTKSTDLAYVIYTSGTTGTPKGVLVEHRGAVNLILALKNYYDLKNSNVQANFLACINHVFDGHVLEVFGTLTKGYTLHIASNELRYDLDALYSYVEKNDIKKLAIPPSILKKNKILKTELLVVAGEKPDRTVLDCYMQNNIKVINEYGPTEATVCSSLKFYVKNEEKNIGSPIKNVKYYVLTSNLVPLPVGAIGELYIGGVAVCRGYLNRPELVAQKFLRNPFQSEFERLQVTFGANGKNDRLYKTGDIVRWLPNGEIEYVGRDDFQKKIRGLRIELPEIEAVLSSYPLIQQCAVLVKNYTASDNTENKYIVGYYVSDKKLDEHEILIYMQAKLPAYMIPNALVHLHKLPLTLNGKLDQRQLSDPLLTNTLNYVSPRNEIEVAVCKIFSNILGLSEGKIGIKDNFFRLGGNSILAIKLIAKLNEYFGSHLKISDIFVHQNIESLLPKIVQTKDKYQVIVKLNQSKTKPNMFMIHSGISGCEVYFSLANKLSESFCCYGVDSYNLYCEPKISDLHELASYYLNYIENVMEQSESKEYFLLGWSLGGQIAIEIASILEEKGIKNINIYLLDTLLMDDNLLNLQLSIEKEQILNAYRTYFISKSFEKNYMEKVISNIEIEKNIANQKMSCLLKSTRILLFIATLDDPYIKYPNSTEIYEYVSTLQDNNIGKLLIDGARIRVVKLNDVHHFNILSREDIIISEITAN